MQSTLPFYPVQASNFAGSVDALFSFILLTCVFFSVLVTLLIIVAALKFKAVVNERRLRADTPISARGNPGSTRLAFREKRPDGSYRLMAKPSDFRKILCGIWMGAGTCHL